MPSVAILVGHRGGKRAARFPGTRGWRKELVDEAGIKTCSGRVLANLLEVADVDGVLQRPGDGGFFRRPPVFLGHRRASRPERVSAGVLDRASWSRPDFAAQTRNSTTGSMSASGDLALTVRGI